MTISLTKAVNIRLLSQYTDKNHRDLKWDIKWKCTTLLLLKQSEISDGTIAWWLVTASRGVRIASVILQGKALRDSWSFQVTVNLCNSYRMIVTEWAWKARAYYFTERTSAELFSCFKHCSWVTGLGTSRIKIMRPNCILIISTWMKWGATFVIWTNFISIENDSFISDCIWKQSIRY